ncbi:heparin/heparin-sulfate lyase HepB [Paenibacillus sp. YN15]|uniref:heparin/heparin-sulfate lyase HepB n=1 Tax=Paenibacillus sp. YN15 TaxID=1742774 RepID=UPI000DCE7531|nr:heparin/heparin-sulfate lyase HepB [Paenibacillus sp. YN15]RAV05473.1 hypothetical protein DQG13_02290 [Paenibacillus sp. YN15]
MKAIAKRMLALWAAVALLTGIAAVPVHPGYALANGAAAPLVYDLFDNEPAGIKESGGGWQMTTAVNGENTGTITVADVPGGGNRSLRLEDTYADSSISRGPVAVRSFTPQTDSFTVSSRFKWTPVGTGYNTFNMMLYGGSDIAAKLASGTSGQMAIGINGSTNLPVPKTGYYVQPEVWYKVTMLVNMDARTYDVVLQADLFEGISGINPSYNGVLERDQYRMSGLPLYEGFNGSQINKLRFDTGKNSGIWHIDFVTVEPGLMEPLPTPEPPRPPVHEMPEAGELKLEAEEGTIRLPMRVMSDPAASAEAYIVTPAGTPRLDDPSQLSQPTAKYRVNISVPGKYVLKARVITPSGGQNSYYVSLDGGPEQAVNAVVSSEWVLQTVKTYQLGAGEHSIGIKHREIGVKFHYFLLVDEATAPIGELVNPYPAPSVTPPPEHPRLFVRGQHVPLIQANLAKPEMAAAWQQILDDAEYPTNGILPEPAPQGTNYNAAVIRAIQAKALLYLLGGNSQTGREAIAMARNVLATVSFANEAGATRNFGEIIITAGIVYDWCYSLLSQEDKQAIIDKMERFATKMEAGYPPVRDGALTSHSSEAQILRDLLGAGVAIYDEQPRMYEMAAGRIFSEFIDARNFLYPSHYAPQGDSYGHYRYTWEMFASWIYNRMGYGDLFSREQQYTLYSYLYSRRPDGQLLRDGDSNYSRDFRFGQYWTYPLALLLSANYYQDPYLKGELMRQYPLNGTTITPISPIWFILFNDPELKGQSLEDLPLTRYFAEPAGVMLARTGWGGGVESPAVVAEMKVGVYNYSNHQHLDAGHFQLYYKGILANDSGIYQGVGGGYGSAHDNNYNKRTIAHNSVLVYDPNEQFLMGGSGQQVVNDGGQRLPNNRVEPKTQQILETKGYQTAEVDAYGFGPDPARPLYSYLKGDLTQAYSEKVEDYKRSFVFLNLDQPGHPAALVVYDTITAANPDFRKYWLLHSVEEPQVNNGKTVVERTTQDYGGRLINETLLPEAGNLQMEKIGGPGQEFFVFGQNFDESPYYAGLTSDEGKGWRIQASPVAPSATDEFLNVMQVADAGSTGELSAQRLLTDGMVGARIADRLVYFSRSGQLLGDTVSLSVYGSVYDTAGGETDGFVADAKWKVLLTDMPAGYWRIDRNGVEGEVEYEVAVESGTLYFEADEGDYVIRRSGQRTLPLPEPPAGDTPESVPDVTVAIEVDGDILPQAVKPQRQGDAIMAADQSVFAAMGITTNWDMATQTWTAVRGGSFVAMTPGSAAAVAHDGAYGLEAAPYFAADQLYVPLRDVAQKLGFSYTWNYYAQKVILTPLPVTTPGEHVRQLEVMEVISTDDDTTNPYYTIDGEIVPENRWSAEGLGKWIRFDLGGETVINAVGIAWYQGKSRRSYYKLEVSTDGESWVEMFNGASSGQTEQLEFQMIPEVSARYVRIVGYGNDSSLWNSITEVYIGAPQVP